jgi:hypothetical protein
MALMVPPRGALADFWQIEKTAERFWCREQV